MKLKNQYVLASKSDDMVIVAVYSGDFEHPYETVMFEEGDHAIFSKDIAVFDSPQSANKERERFAHRMISYEQSLAANCGCSDIQFDLGYFLNFNIVTLKEVAKMLKTDFRGLKEASIKKGLHSNWDHISIKELS